MIFTSIEFLIFFGITFIVTLLFAGTKVEKPFLLVASYVFYMSWNIACGGLILFTSLLDYTIGRALGVVEKPMRRRLLLAASITTNLGILAFFKYANFIVLNARYVFGWFGWEISPLMLDIVLPAGISFFTFQSMTYTIDVYRRELAPCRSVRDYLLFVSFFPQLIAGPIVRASHLLPMFSNRPKISSLDIEIGIAYFLLGAVKKMVISDQIASHVDLIFSNPAAYNGVTLLVGVLGYAVQIYCDFSGYSDMALGSARMLGFRLEQNFQMPYSSASVTEFWRRWHISLSSYLRDYLYVPLGGNRHGWWMTCRNLLITMLLGGLWHGASWTFVFWGGLHGVALIVHRAWTRIARPEWFKSRLSQFIWRPVAHMLTLGVVLVGWVFFRAQSFESALIYLRKIVTFSSEGVALSSPFILPAVAAVAVIHLAVNKDFNWAEAIAQQSISKRVIGYSVLLLLIVCLGVTNASPFIYFQF